MAAPPAYNANASAYPNLNAAPAQDGPAPNVRYVDQYGNPVDMTGQAQPLQQPAVTYVDQYGNPVQVGGAAPVASTIQQPNVKYVDQFGNPVAAPLQQPNVTYVDQFGNPVAPPTTVGVATGNPNAAVSRETSLRQQRIAGTVFGALGSFLLMVGFFTNTLAVDHVYDIWDITYKCRFTKFTAKCDDSYYSSYYGTCNDLELSWSELCDDEDDYYGYSDYPPFCKTQSTAATYLSFTVFSLLFAVIGTIYVQPCTEIKSFLCKKEGCSCSRVSFLISLFCVILALIIWYGAEEFCIGDTYSDYYTQYDWWYDIYGGWSVGNTIVVHIIGAIMIFVASLLAKGPEIKNDQK